MKISPRTIRRNAAGSIDFAADRIVIRLPDPLLLRLIARSVLLTVAVVSLPWIRTGIAAAGRAPAVGTPWIEAPFFLPMLLHDLKRQGILKPGDRALFLGDPGSRLPVLDRNLVAPVPDYKKLTIADRSVDFVLAGDGSVDQCFSFVNRVLRVGGVLTVRLGSDSSQPFLLPSNYRIAYIRKFGSTFVAFKKIANAPYIYDSTDDNGVRQILAGRSSEFGRWVISCGILRILRS